MRGILYRAGSYSDVTVLEQSQRRREPGKNRYVQDSTKVASGQNPGDQGVLHTVQTVLVFDFQDQISLGNCGKRKYPQGRTLHSST